MTKDSVMKWLHIVLGQKCQDLNGIIERISILNHQTENYKQMAEQHKEKVIDDLVKDMEFYDWDVHIKEVCNEAKSEVSE